MSEKDNKTFSNKVDLTDNSSFQRRALKKMVQFSLGLIYSAIVLGSTATPAVAVNATEAAKGVVAAEGGKAALNHALKVSRGRLALSVDATITCITCIPAAGAAASLGLCIACGILVAKVLG